MTKHVRYLILIVPALASPLFAQPWEPLPADPYFATYKPAQAPACKELLLKPGDKLALCGDSITEQKMYSHLSGRSRSASREFPVCPS